MNTLSSRHQPRVAVVPVRAGSKGLEGKNLLRIDDTPLYLRAVQQGLRTIGRVLLSTDIKEINQDDLPEGCTLCPRPAELSADDTPMAPVIDHLINSMNLQEQTLVLLQATTPLREDYDIQAALSLHDQGRHDLVMSVVESDPGTLKYGTLSESDFTAMRDTSHCFQNRQNLPKVHKPNGAVFVFSAASFMSCQGFPTTRVGAVEMPSDRSSDIDTLDDFLYVEQLVRSGVVADREQGCVSL
ncbi:MAG: hypothetical protein AB8B79_22775 [Granulosicoccus sp.]